LYKLFIPTKNTFNSGLNIVNGNKAYVTSGLGEVVFPMRLFNPPTIEIIETY
jgi:predicted MPP superfamily phosphohydrolase